MSNFKCSLTLCKNQPQNEFIEYANSPKITGNSKLRMLIDSWVQLIEVELKFIVATLLI